MIKKGFYIALTCVIFMVGTSSFLEVPIEEEELSERVKIALRDAGNQLLLTQEDTTSLILPILKIETSKYQLSFEEELFFEPTMLVESITNSFKKNKPTSELSC